jgi:predicted metal-binding protein
MTNLKSYITDALDQGAKHALIINAKDIVLDPRTMLKCRFGCSGWGHNWTCPSAPGAVTVWEFAQIIKHYKKAMLIHTLDKKLSQSISYAIEQKAYTDGAYFAFSLSDCALCKKCAYPKPCRAYKKARPAMQAVGIDVFSTVRKHGLLLKTLKSKTEVQNWYSLVLID